MDKIIKAYATNTRLMGVIGLIVYFENYVEVYHLDYEEYGLDGYYRVDINDTEKIENTINRTIGGLGGKLKKIDDQEVYFLIKTSFDISDEYIYDFELDYEKIKNIELKLSSKEINKLYNKISADLSNDNELINYFLMRKIANDQSGANFISKIKNDFEMVDIPSTLLKNEIKKNSENVFYTKSLIDYKNNYMQITCDIKVEDMKVIEAKVIEKLKITSMEASLILNKKEYIAVFNIGNNGIETDFHINNKLMQSFYENGTLYTKYNDNNSHVEKPIYFLSEDIFGIYYFTDCGQLVVSSFENENMDFMINQLEKYEGLTLNGDYEVDKSLIYSFIISLYDDFYEFLNMEKR